MFPGLLKASRATQQELCLRGLVRRSMFSHGSGTLSGAMKTCMQVEPELRSAAP